MTSTGGSTNDQTELAGLNRDIVKTQEITKDTITGALNFTTTIDNRIFTAAGWKSIGKDHDNLGKNLLTSNIALSDLVGAVPGSPIWASRWIDVNNNEIDISIHSLLQMIKIHQNSFTSQIFLYL